MKERLWRITDHICRDCGGRVLCCMQGNGMTPEGTGFIGAQIVALVGILLVTFVGVVSRTVPSTATRTSACRGLQPRSGLN